jgi:hypothetical protein
MKVIGNVPTWVNGLLIPFGIVILATIAYITISFIMKGSEAEGELLHNKLQQEVSRYDEGKAPCIDLSKVTNFPWDHVYIFRSYRTPKEIDSVLGYYWLDSRFTDIKWSDHYSLIVFTSHKHVVQYIEYNGPGDFSSADNNAGYEPNSSCFIKNEHGYITEIDRK